MCLRHLQQIRFVDAAGEVQHWVWLIRAFMDQISLESVDYMLGYLVSQSATSAFALHIRVQDIPELSCPVQARIGKYISPDEEWLRMLVRELTPVLKVMRDNILPSGKTLSKSMSYSMSSTNYRIAIARMICTVRGLDQDSSQFVQGN